MRAAWPALAALTVAAAALRLPFLANESLSWDETFTRAIAGAGSIGDVWRGVEATEATPPLHYLLTWAWVQVGGLSDASVRAVAAVASTLSAPVAWLALRRLVGERAALGAAAITAASPMLVSYALETRAYSLLVLLSLLSLWALGLVLERPTGRRLALWALAATAMLWTHYFAAFVVAAEVGVLLWRLPGERRRVAAFAAAAGAAALPLAAVFLDQNDERSSAIGELPLGERVEQAGRQLAAGPNPPSAPLEGLALLLAVGGIAAGALLAWRGRRGGRTAAAARRAGPLALAAIAAAATLVPLALAVTGVDDHFFARNLLVAWGALAALAALGLTRLRAVPLALYLMACVATVVWVHSDWRYRNADYDAAAEALGRDAAGRPVLVYPGFDGRVAAVYLDRAEAPGPVTAREVWVVVEPGRIDRRDLRALPGFPRAGVPGFAQVEERERRGFRLLRFRAPAPAPVDPRALGPDVLGGPPALLPP